MRGRIDGDPVLRETRIWATWEYVRSVGGGQQGMVGLGLRFSVRG